MKTIYLVRHGKASLEGTEEERVLTQEGVNQAEQLSAALQKLQPMPTKLYSSPYRRAIQSFEPFANKNYLAIEPVHSFHELCLSSEPVDDLMQARKNLWADPHFKLVGGESRNEATQRALRALHAIKDNLGENQHAAVMSHGTLIGSLVKEIGDEDYTFENWRSMGMPDIFKLTFIGDEISVENIGCEEVDSFRISDAQPLNESTQSSSESSAAESFTAENVAAESLAQTHETSEPQAKATENTEESNIAIDKDYLKEKQYKQAKYLEARIAIHSYGSGESFHSWIYNQLKINEPVKILDVGAGTGEFWKENLSKLPAGSSVVMTDFSDGMVDKIKQNVAGDNVSYAVADIENLNYADESFDIVMAHHVIYHAEDKQKALSELKRVVKKDGFISITSNSDKHMVNVYELGISLDPNFPTDRIIDSFTEEIADTMLLSHYSKVQKLVNEDLLKVNNMEILINYVKSGVEPRNITLANGFWENYAAICAMEMNSRGFVGIMKRSPLYICRK